MAPVPATQRAMVDRPGRARADRRAGPSECVLTCAAAAAKKVGAGLSLFFFFFFNGARSKPKPRAGVVCARAVWCARRWVAFFLAFFFCRGAGGPVRARAAVRRRDTTTSPRRPAHAASSPPHTNPSALQATMAMATPYGLQVGARAARACRVDARAARRIGRAPPIGHAHAHTRGPGAGADGGASGVVPRTRRWRTTIYRWNERRRARIARRTDPPPR